MNVHQRQAAADGRIKPTELSTIIGYYRLHPPSLFSIKLLNHTIRLLVSYVIRHATGNREKLTYQFFVVTFPQLVT